MSQPLTERTAGQCRLDERVRTCGAPRIINKATRTKEQSLYSLPGPKTGNFLFLTALAGAGGGGAAQHVSRRRRSEAVGAVSASEIHAVSPVRRWRRDV